MRIADLRDWFRVAPPGTLVRAEEVLAMLDAALGGAGAVPATPATVTAPVSWRERVWVVPAETRLGVREVAEATGRSVDWVYKHTGAGGTGLRLPHRKIDGHLVFLAGELRAWLGEAETIVEQGGRRGLRVARP